MTDNLIVSHNAPFYFIQNPGHIRRKHMFKKKLAIFALAATAVLQIASGALSNQQILEEKTVAGWVAENQTALLYLMTREQRAVRHQGESDMAGSRWYWRTTPLSTGNALLQAVDIEVSLQEDFSSVIQSRRAWFSAVGGQQ